VANEGNPLSPRVRVRAFPSGTVYHMCSLSALRDALIPTFSQREKE
jgi:hypothetical protein